MVYVVRCACLCALYVLARFACDVLCGDVRSGLLLCLFVWAFCLYVRLMCV